METLQLELDTSTWSSIFNSADDGHQSFSLKEKFDEWKPKILMLIRDYVKVCNIDLMSVQKCGEFPMIMGYCKFANCTRSIQIKVIDVRKLELQYSVEECITSMSNQEDASENRANLSAKVCDYCLKQFLSTDPASEKEAMKNHLRVCHSQPQAQIYSCKCGRRFNKKAARNSHLKRCERVTDVENAMLSCEICHQSFTSVAKLQRHAKTCKATVYCQVCKKDLASGVTLERHMASTHQIQTPFTSERRKYPCDKCEKVFWKKYNLESHSLMHSDIKPFVCDVEGCNKRFKREVTLRQHINTRHQNRIVTLFCALCPAQFKSAGGLKLHMDTIHNLGPGRPRKFDCNRCDKKFKCQADLTIHIVTHTKEKNFACDLCDQKFSRNSSLKDHLNVHRQIFMCKWCNKSFGRDRYLKSHHEICPQGPNGSQKESFTENLLCQIVDEPSSQEKIIVRRESHLISQDNSLINRTDQLIHQENPLIGRGNHVTGQENVLIGQENQLKSPQILEDQTIQSADIVLNEETCEPLLIKDINTEAINENMVRNEIAEAEPKIKATQPQPSQIVIVSPALKRLEKARKMKVMNNIPKEKILNLRIANTSL